METDQDNEEQLNPDSEPLLLVKETKNANTDALDQAERKKELLKLLLLAFMAFAVFMVFSTWPSVYTAVFGVASIVTVAKLTEWMSTKAERFPCKNRGVVITGCDTGFGHALAKHLNILGATVFAGCLYEDGEGAKALKALESPRLHVMQMDVTNTQQVAKTLEYVTSKLPGKGLWGLVNNAGLNFLGSLETTSMEQYERIIGINQTGMVRVTKTFLPLVRKAKGRIVNVTSIKGKVSEPLNAAYGMTKFAGETFSDILRMEMRKFGVTVCIIEPGDFGGATGCLEITRIQDDVEEMWKGMDEGLRDTYGRQFVDEHIKCAELSAAEAAMDIQPVIEAMTDALFALKPKTRYLIPGGAKWYDKHVFRARLAKILPEFITDSMWVHDLRNWPIPPDVLNDPSLAHSH